MELAVVVGGARFHRHFWIVLLRVHVHYFMCIITQRITVPTVAVLLLESIVFAVAVNLNLNWIKWSEICACRMSLIDGHFFCLLKFSHSELFFFVSNLWNLNSSRNQQNFNIHRKWLKFRENAYQQYCKSATNERCR